MQQNIIKYSQKQEHMTQMSKSNQDNKLSYKNVYLTLQYLNNKNFTANNLKNIWEKRKQIVRIYICNYINKLFKW